MDIRYRHAKLTICSNEESCKRVFTSFLHTPILNVTWSVLKQDDKTLCILIVVCEDQIQLFQCHEGQTEFTATLNVHTVSNPHGAVCCDNGLMIYPNGATELCVVDILQGTKKPVLQLGSSSLLNGLFNALSPDTPIRQLVFSNGHVLVAWATGMSVVLYQFQNPTTCSRFEMYVLLPPVPTHAVALRRSSAILTRSISWTRTGSPCRPAIQLRTISSA